MSFFCNMQLEGIMSVISSDPCKDGNARFTKVPLKACLIKYELDKHVLISLNNLFSFCGFAAKLTCAFLVYKKKWRNSQNSKLFELEKQCYLPNF